MRTKMDEDRASSTTVAERLTLNSLQMERLSEVVQVLKKRAVAPKHGAVGVDQNRHFYDVKFSDGLPASNEICLVACDKETQTPALITRNGPGDAPDRETQNAMKMFKAARLLVPGFLKASGKALKNVSQPNFCLKTPSSPLPFSGNEPPLVFKGKLMMGKRELKLSDLVNSLGLGAAGSGKTYSYILPFIEAFLAYSSEQGKQAAVLIVDPKGELLAHVSAQLEGVQQTNRLVVIGKCDPFLFFPKDDGLFLSDRYYKIRDLVPGTTTEGDGMRWQSYADNLSIDLLKADQAFLDACGLRLFESIITVVELKDQMEAGQWAALNAIYRFGMGGVLNMRLLADAFTLFMHCVGLGETSNPFARYSGDRSEMMDQWFFNARTASVITEYAGSPEISQVVDFDLRRYGPSVERKRLNIVELIDSGKVLVYQPAASKAHDVAGRALKSQFFQAAMERKDMSRNVVYCCDEFQKYVTTDKDTGEANFLDRSRAYRVNALLASQSLAAIRAAMGATASSDSALTSMLANLTTKLIFRTTDPETVQKMEFFIPQHPHHGQHVLRVRPPSTLETGESYFVVGNRWGRSKYQFTHSAHPIQN